MAPELGQLVAALPDDLENSRDARPFCLLAEAQKA